MKKNIKRIALALIAVAVLVFAFWWGGDSPYLHGFEVKKEESAPIETGVREIESIEEAPGEKVTEETPEETKAESPSLPKTEAPPREEEKKANTCLISVGCDTILENTQYISASLAEILPQDGVILAECEVEISEGESVFDVLLRATRENGIHLEFVKTPGSNSAYIEGMANIYEFDCGELSGWMYKVNGSFPKLGCSEYILKPGDKVEWVYTCDSGKDVGAREIK